MLRGVAAWLGRVVAFAHYSGSLNSDQTARVHTAFGGNAGRNAGEGVPMSKVDVAALIALLSASIILRGLMPKHLSMRSGNAP